jgi:hypothetical protein
LPIDAHESARFLRDSASASITSGIRAQAKRKKTAITATQKAMFGHARLNQPKATCDAAGRAMMANLSMAVIPVSQEIPEDAEWSGSKVGSVWRLSQLAPCGGSPANPSPKPSTHCAAKGSAQWQAFPDTFASRSGAKIDPPVRWRRRHAAPTLAGRPTEQTSVFRIAGIGTSYSQKGQQQCEQLSSE